MGTQLALPEVLSALTSTYKSIDVRTIATEVSGITYNVATSISFSVLPCSARKKDMLTRLKTYGPLLTGPLKFSWSCLPLEALTALEEQLHDGALKIGDCDAKLGASVTLASFVGYISEDSRYIEKSDSSVAWRAMRSTFPTDAINTELGRYLQYVNDPGILKQLDLSGFHGFREFASNFLGSPDSDLSGPSCIEIVAPVPVRVARIEIDPAHKKVRAYIHRHRSLARTLKLRGEVLDGLWQRSQASLTFGQLVGSKGDLAVAEGVFDLPRLDGHIQLRIMHDQLGIICTPRIPIRSNVPTAYLNPMFEALKRFCPSDEFRSLCTEPRTPPKDTAQRKDMPQRSFEQYIQWLLTCFGFVAIQLGSKESLTETDAERGVQIVRGSLDLLAYNEQRRLLLLAACKMNPPPDRDFHNLINVQATLEKTLLPEANVKIALAMFTAAEHCLPHSSYRGENFVALFDKQKINSLVDALEEGRVKSLYESLVDRSDPFELPARDANQAVESI